MTLEYNGGAEFPAENKSETPLTDLLHRKHATVKSEDQESWFIQEAMESHTSLERQLHEKTQQLAEAKALLNAPELHSFRDGVVLEAAHQRQRWSADVDASKMPADWFWLVGYLAGKALHAQVAGNEEKALHHTISTAAALANWHAAILAKHGGAKG